MLCRLLLNLKGAEPKISRPIPSIMAFKFINEEKFLISKESMYGIRRTGPHSCFSSSGISCYLPQPAVNCDTSADPYRLQNFCICTDRENCYLLTKSASHSPSRNAQLLTSFHI